MTEQSIRLFEGKHRSQRRELPQVVVPAGQSRAPTHWKEAARLGRDVIEQARTAP